MASKVLPGFPRTDSKRTTSLRRNRRVAVVCIVLLAAAACSPTPPQRAATSPPARSGNSSSKSAERAPQQAAHIPGAPSAGAAPTEALYVCVSQTGGQRTQTPIALEPRVAALCARHPEMGPCQFERETCRQRGGRVFAANGEEITLATEDQYDRKVMRSRFRSN